MQDRHHQSPVVLHHRGLAGGEGEGLGPAEAEPDGQRADLRRLVDPARVTRDVEPRDAEATAGGCDRHQRVQHRGRALLTGILAVAAGLEADRVHTAVDRGHAQDLLDLVLRFALSQVDGLTAEAAGLRQPLLIQVGDDHDGGPQQMSRCRCSQTHRAGSGDVDGRPYLDAGAVRSVEAGGEDVREHGEVHDLRQRLVPVRELQQIPVRIGHQHVLGLTADPPTHVDVAVGAARPVGVDVETDSGFALLTVAAPAAGDVERHRDDVADLDEFDVRTAFDHLAGDLVAENEVRGRCRSPAHHVLVRTADVRGDGLENDPVRHLPADIRGVHTRSVLQLEGGIVDVDDLDDARALVGNCSVPSHEVPS